MTIVDGGSAFSDNDQSGMGYSPTSRTGQDVRRAVQRSFGDESGVQLEDADILMWINDAQDEIVNRNRILKGTSSTVSAAGQQSYTFPSARIHQIESIHYGGSRLPNMPFAQAENHVIGQGLELSQQGEPELWYEWGGRFSFWPTPATSQSIVLYYTLRPERLTTLDSVLSVPDKYYQNVVNYVLRSAYEMDEDWQASQAKQQQFDASLNDLAEEERTAQHMTYSTITLID